ncbi:MAG: cytochrome-c peroxidase [Bacteroidales bacterium]|nr:cytochrome-c peroxidase [Bacteroidales bacterium]
MKKVFILLSAAVLLFAWACKNGQQTANTDASKEDSVLVMAKGFFQPLPKEAVNPDNPLTPEKVALGKTLYFDNRLSMHNTQSCNTCHNVATYGVDNKATSTGDLGKNGNRNSPTTFNAALHFLQFWDGRMKTVEEQAGGPVMNPVEMNMPAEKEVLARLNKSEGYKKMFAAAFPGEKDPVTFENMKKSIAAFERTLLTPSKFDKYLEGDATALNDQEKKGLHTFISTGCIACHTGPLLGGNMFQKFPLIGTDYKSMTGSVIDDKGKMEVTKDEADKYMFKVPSLRNVAETWPYFHDGSVKELDKAITIMAKLELGKDLTPEQTADMVTFIKALSADVPAEAKQAPTMP